MAPTDRASHLERLRELFADMDASYARAAAAAGFDCRGCEESCCRSRFYHHTLIELLYLQEGVRALPPAARHEIRAAAQSAVAAAAADPEARPMCPLNAGGRCRIYAHRPMICRLHGVAHELHPPGRPIVIGPGCVEYERSRGPARQGERFDRTPLYARLAGLESGLRESEGLRRRIRMTIAEMLLADEVPA
jgi:Fe-S-cluster containining protein